MDYYAFDCWCPHCGQAIWIHLGSDSPGWAFRLAVYPELGIRSLDDWEQWLAEKPDRIIRDDQGKTVGFDEIRRKAQNRIKAKRPPHSYEIAALKGAAEYDEETGLNRWKVGHFGCIGRDGTCDLMQGELSVTIWRKKQHGG